ncbi:MAG TPA: AAA family ATPase, partial [Gemmatimonadaceae bacterium]|nr:AAA family ATPase [Gemmatimonadaceae bacterium]
MSSPRTQQSVERLAQLTPSQIVEELDRYIVGQADAKKAVAIALRNRWRRQRAPDAIRDEISPNNIILVGPTGVGKTEIARRLARLVGAPFVKVEASKFTEVGYVGRDVESMVRDLVDSAINMVRGERETEVQEIAKQKVEDRLLDLLLPTPPDIKQSAHNPTAAASGGAHLFVVSPAGSVSSETDAAEVRYKRTREKLKQLLLDGQLDEREIEIEVTQQAPVM